MANVTDTTDGPSRRQLLTAGAAASLAAAAGAVSFPSAAYSATVDDIPELAPRSFQSWFAARPAARTADGRPRLLLLPDTFTNYLDPDIGAAAVATLEALGYQVEVPTGDVCCGLTWVSTGQLDHAKRVLRRTLTVLKPWLDAGVPAHFLGTVEGDRLVVAPSDGDPVVDLAADAVAATWRDRLPAAFGAGTTQG